MSKSWIYREIAAGNFPPPVMCSGAARWVLSEINAWVAQKMQARDRHGANVNEAATRVVSAVEVK